MFVVRPAPVNIKKAAAQAQEPEWRLIHRLADARLEPLQQEFLESVERAKGRVAVSELADALQARDLVKAQAIVGVQDFGMDAVKVQNILQGLVAAVGTSVAARMERQFKVSLTFDVLNPRAVSFVTQHTGELIRQVSDETIAAVKDIVQRAFEQGGHPYQQAKMIQGHIGLTERQSRAVENLKARQLEAGITQERADWQAERYAGRLLRDRAELIGRTETISAANAGQQESWQQAVDAGLIDPDEFEMEWITTPDDRACQECLDLDGERAPIGGVFPGGLTGPPAHPGCRCAAGLSRRRD
jgi:SPP1 gp7 family putative phage head morphogenesis protein